MYRIFLALVLAALLSLGIAYPNLIFHKDQIDSLMMVDEEALLKGNEAAKTVPGFDIPVEDGEPLPPPPDDDEFILAKLDP